MSSDTIPRVPGMSRHAIELASREFVKRTGNKHLLTSPGAFPASTVFEYLDQFYPELRTGVENLGDRIEGEARPDGTILLSERTWRGLQANDGRSRNTAVHEMGHGVLHCKYLKQALLDGEQLHRKPPRKPYECPEWQANGFSSAVLMPSEAVNLIVSEQRRTDLIPIEITLSGVFQVSYSAARVRLDVMRQTGLLVTP
jgi:hypothetical protein